MSSTYIPEALRQLVAVQACYRCGYCLTSEAIVGTPMEIDHLIPQSLGGPTEEANLWLACSLCHDHKSSRIAFLDPLTGEIVRLFDPRRQVWREHFVWTAKGDRMVGLPPTGRSTIAALHLNRPLLVRARQAWVPPMLGYPVPTVQGIDVTEDNVAWHGPCRCDWASEDHHIQGPPNGSETRVG